MSSVTPSDLHRTDEIIINLSGCNKEEPIIPLEPLPFISRKITPEPSIEFSNYDVLLMSCDANEPVYFAPGNHVGNQRFRVMLSLFRQRYIQADAFFDEEECTKIAKEVMATVHRGCFPNGRFYEQGRNNQWQELRLGPSTVTIIRRCLENEPKDSLHVEEKNPKRVCRRLSVVSMDSEEGFITSPSRFDVICDADELKLKQDCQHTGNNRLKILLDLNSKSYKKSGPVRKRSITQEVVSSIIDDSSSQFLRLDKSTGIYNPMSRELAFSCIKNSLDTAGEGEKRQFRESEVKKLMARKKKKSVLGRFEHRKGIKCNNLPSSTSTPTTFAAFQ